MRIEVTIAKTSPLPAGAIDALAGELSRRIRLCPLITCSIVTTCFQNILNYASLRSSR